MDEKELKILVEEGEGYKVEFKESLNGIEKDIVAFANSSGGKILLGVRDNGVIKGINITNRLKAQIQDIASNCRPVPEILLEKSR